VSSNFRQYRHRKMALIDEESDYDMLVTAHHFAHITNKIKTKLDTLLLNKLLIQTINSILVTQGKIEDKNTSPNGILQQVKQSQWQKFLRRLYIDLVEIYFIVDKFDKNIQREGIIQLQHATS